jgi:beta-glucosidase
VFYISAIPSLCIPAIGEEDGPVGVGDGLTGVTQMPAAVSLAATFDPSLARDYGAVVGAEEHAKGAMINLGPTVNIDRDPRWGRSFEAYTEDPYLNAAMATADIEGVQSQGEMSMVKHFAVYNQETNRNAHRRGRPPPRQPRQRRRSRRPAHRQHLPPLQNRQRQDRCRLPVM